MGIVKTLNLQAIPIGVTQEKMGDVILGIVSRWPVYFHVVSQCAVPLLNTGRDQGENEVVVGPRLEA